MVSVDTGPAGRPVAVRVLCWLLLVTAVATAAVEWLNWWYAQDGGYGLAVRTAWAVLRSLGLLILIWHVRRGRAGAPPFGLILAVTTIFSLARLVVPREGYPALPGIAGFAVVTALCLAVIGMLYRSPAVRDYLSRPQQRLALTRDGVARRPVTARRPPVQGWLLTTRVAAYTYSPLMLVACVIAAGTVFEGEFTTVPVIVVWFVTALAVSYAVLLTTFFLLRGRGWARRLMVGITLLVLLVHLPLCWALLGVDGLVRDGGPVLVAAVLALYGLWRSGRTGPVSATEAPGSTTSPAGVSGTASIT